MTKYERSRQIILSIVMLLIGVITVIPFLILVSVSFSDEKMIGRYGYGILPRGFTLEAYKYIVDNTTGIFRAYGVTFTFSILTMLAIVLTTAMAAYPLTKKDLPGKTQVQFYFFFTMLFGGGAAPVYILITRYLRLADTIWVYVIPSMISVWYIFIMRANFQAIPNEISESAIMDGASHYTIFLKLILPLSKPILASVGMLTFMAKWNDWSTSMYYINKRDDLVSLQYFLQRILNNAQVLQQMQNKGIVVDVIDMPTETVRMAMSVLVAGPAIFTFPFFQKYFAKGLTIGSVKG